MYLECKTLTYITVRSLRREQEISCTEQNDNIWKASRQISLLQRTWCTRTAQLHNIGGTTKSLIRLWGLPSLVCNEKYEPKHLQLIITPIWACWVLVVSRPWELISISINKGVDPYKSSLFFLEDVHKNLDLFRYILSVHIISRNIYIHIVQNMVYMKDHECKFS